MYRSEAVVRREMERSRNRVVQTDNLRNLLVIRRIDRLDKYGELQEEYIDAESYKENRYMPRVIRRKED